MEEKQHHTVRTRNRDNTTNIHVCLLSWLRI